METRGYPKVRAICFDEIPPQRRRSQRRRSTVATFVLAISAPELGLVLDVLTDRNKETLLKSLRKRGNERGAVVQFACSDMWDAYQEAAEQKLPNAKRVVDRFHVMKNLNEALTKVRCAIQKDADETTRDLLKGCRWLLVKKPKNLTEDQQQKLAGMLATSPELKSCYELKESVS